MLAFYLIACRFIVEYQRGTGYNRLKFTDRDHEKRMKIIEVDDDLYRYIASQTQHIGESASDILRRLLVGNLSTTAYLNQVSGGDHNNNNVETGSVSRDPLAASVSANALTANVPMQNMQKGILVSKDSGQHSLADGQQAISSLLHSSPFCAVTNVIERFMLILSTLYRIDPARFALASQEMGRGRTRVYFADNEAALLASGNTTRPKIIPNTPFWVITNNNTERKRKMVSGLMTQMGFDSDFVESVIKSI